MGALPRSGTEQGRAHRGSDVRVRGAPVRFLGLPRPRLGGLERWEVSVRAQEARSPRPSRWRGGFPPKAPGNSPVPPFPAPGLAPVGVSWLIGLCRHMAFFLCVCVHIFFPVWGGVPPEDTGHVGFGAHSTTAGLRLNRGCLQPSSSIQIRFCSEDPGRRRVGGRGGTVNPAQGCYLLAGCGEGPKTRPWAGGVRRAQRPGLTPRAEAGGAADRRRGLWRDAGGEGRGGKGPTSPAPPLARPMTEEGSGGSGPDEAPPQAEDSRQGSAITMLCYVSRRGTWARARVTQATATDGHRR